MGSIATLEEGKFGDVCFTVYGMCEGALVSGVISTESTGRQEGEMGTSCGIL